jgi:hypothetical protein
VGGWIKLEKDLLTDPRVLQTAARLRHARVTPDRDCHERDVTLLIGALARLWVVGDTHVCEDDVLALGPDQINELVGIDGFCQILPTDWLQILDADSVKLPGFHSHNGTTAKAKAQAAQRQQKHRVKSVTLLRDSHKRDGNGAALPDRDLDQDLDIRKPPTPLQSKGAGLRKSSRPERLASMEAWRRITVLIDHVAQTSTLTWAYVQEYCTDQDAFAAANSVGFRQIADRDRYTETQLRDKFRDEYERGENGEENRAGTSAAL